VNTSAGIRHLWLPHWLGQGGLDLSTDDHRKLRKALQDLGIDGRGWKLYVAYGDGLFRPLGTHWLHREDARASATNALAYLRLLMGCETDLAPPPVLAASLADCNLPGNSIAAMPTSIFRGAWRALVQAQYQGMGAGNFVDREFIPAMRWFYAQPFANQTANREGKADWLWLRRRWAAELRLTALPRGPREWSTPVSNARIGNLSFIPLQSESALQDEGEAMHHCIAMFAEFCRTGCTRVFSVRNAISRYRVATLAIAIEGGSWVVNDLKGSRNATPEQDVTRATSRFVDLLRKCAPPSRSGGTCAAW
jgi:hypothetical protein